MPRTRNLAYPTSPMRSGLARKFINRSAGYIGANIFGPDGRPTAIPVEPGGEVWLTEAEERMTAEAPNDPANNPFLREWEEPVEWSSDGEIIRTETRTGVLQLDAAEPRPIGSSRYTVPRAADEDEEEAVGVDVPEQPPVQGQPSPDEVIGTPEAPERNAEALAQREGTAEQPTRKVPLPVS